MRGTNIFFGLELDVEEPAGEVDARPFLRESRQSRNLDWATRRDWKDWVRVWMSLFREVFSWLSWGWERSVILTVVVG